MKIIKTPKAPSWLCHCRVLFFWLVYYLEIFGLCRWKFRAKWMLKIEYIYEYIMLLYFLFFLKTRNIRVILFIQFWLDMYVTLNWYIGMYINHTVIFSSGFSNYSNLWRDIMWLNLPLKLSKLYVLLIFIILFTSTY